MLDVNLTLPIVMAMFLVFAVLMNQLFFGPVTRALAARREHIRKLQTEASEALAKSQALQTDHSERLRAAQGQAADTIQTALKAAEERRNAMLEQVKAEVGREVETARASIRAERDAAVASLSSEVTEFGDVIKRKVLAPTPALSSTGGHEA